jgi:hypothetical protein
VLSCLTLDACFQRNELPTTPHDMLLLIDLIGSVLGTSQVAGYYWTSANFVRWILFWFNHIWVLVSFGFGGLWIFLKVNYNRFYNLQCENRKLRDKKE